ncbi:DUF4138 domain-containing protein [Pedobacter frigidisoli]|uniref:DUF4138 domain-containing protein n=1 Tax=Pedobacter frigidisoli TaxID=2530455 RepID=A0A4V2MMQ8_9SPHI|nr:DUF4138 domain-containing protein [Pedobacter frigidisoli]TCD07696.1 DUF4138 domain-containing protein [Pedobacter frigidisoli]
MKNIIFVIALILTGATCPAQETTSRLITDLPKIFLSPGLSFHLQSPEPISYVDISPGFLKGDLPLANLLRLRLDKDSCSQLSPGLIGSITAVGETFIAQYQIFLLDDADLSRACVEMEIGEQHMRPIERSDISLSSAQISSHARSLLSRRESRPLRSVSKNGISLSLNGIYTAADLVFLDLNITNQGSIPYEIDQLKFEIVDKKINKATSYQSIPLPILYSLYPLGSFQSSFRNIYVLKKATFPAFKQLLISLSETQLSGRTASLSIDYRQVLQADTF